jgi:hypothetical protein
MAENWEKIVLSAKVFGHLSQGLYRTPAGAIKELISNAFDADAYVVRIHTDFPRFESFSCEDTGGGMPHTEFARLMNSGIGNSPKRSYSQYTSSKLGRPYIGRLGLGILALAQICSQFDIISHHKGTETAFKATIKFPAYTREEIDKIDASEFDLVEGGQYKVETIKFDATKPGLRIFTMDLRESFRKRMRGLAKYGNKNRAGHNIPYATFESFIDSIYTHQPLTKSLNLQSDYEQLLFGLALAAPLKFLSHRNVAASIPPMVARQERIEKYKFEVRVDNLLLAHPVCLPSDQKGNTAESCEVKDPVKDGFLLEDGAFTAQCAVSRRPIRVAESDERFNLYDFQYDNTVAGRKLKFGGYLFQQTGRLYPRDIQGILIRIHDVAIGKYDNSMLSYPLAEGPRYSMVSGEIFIEAGFEDALNIDRDSFNELHPHFMRVQAYVHGLLHELIFPETWNEEKGRNKARRVAAHRESAKKFMSGFTAATGEKFSTIKEILPTAPHKRAPKAGSNPVLFVKSRREIQVDRRHPLLQLILKRTKFASLMEKIVIAFERASIEPNITRRRELFYKLLLEIVTGL